MLTDYENALSDYELFDAPQGLPTTFAELVDASTSIKQALNKLDHPAYGAVRDDLTLSAWCMCERRAQHDSDSANIAAYAVMVDSLASDWVDMADAQECGLPTLSEWFGR